MDEPPTRKVNENFLTALYFIFKVVPMLLAGVAIYLGYRLFILGVTGQASLSVNSKDVSGQLLNAAPGLFFAIGGFVVIVVTVWKGVNINFGGPGSPAVVVESERAIAAASALQGGHGGGGGGAIFKTGRFALMKKHDIKDPKPGS